MIVDFDANGWRTPPLQVQLAGNTYEIPAPTIAHTSTLRILAGQVMARALGVRLAPLTEQERAALVDPLPVAALGADVAEQMATNGVSAPTIDRVAIYAAHYWTSGKEYADRLATAMWAAPTPIPDTGATPPAED